MFNIKVDGLQRKNEHIHFFLKVLYQCSRFINLELPHSGMLNNPNEVLNVCASPCVSVANKCFVFSFFSAFVMFFCFSAN